MRENLWWKLIAEYWSDPRNIIGPPGALVRRVFKLIWLALSVYVLFFIAGPSQVASWQLWMEDDKLAHDIGWGFTFASAMMFAMVGFTAEATKPLRVPIFIPYLEGNWKNLRVRTTHVHIPNVRVGVGSIFAIALFGIAMLGQWNYYLHDNLMTGGASVAAIDGSTSRVREAEAALTEHDRSTRESLAIIDQAIAQTSAGSPTGRSRLVAQRATLTTQAAQIRTQLAQDLRDARGETVTVRTTAADPRPVDGQLAAATGMDRGLVASLLDLLRSGVVEGLLMLGAALGLVAAPSRLGVPVDEADFAPAPVEEMAETGPAPDAPADPPPRRRFVLPEATDKDLAEAVVVGPHAPPAGAEEKSADLGPDTETAASDDPSASADDVSHETPEEPLDPFTAEALNPENA